MTVAKPPDWYAADRAYQLHHLSCQLCIAAGTSPTRHERCDEGAALWTIYNEAGDPPQFAWLTKKKDRNGKHQHHGKR